MDPHYRFYHYILGYISIIVGAVCWWFMITFFVNKVRSHFNVRSMWMINRIIAVLLLIMAIIGFVHGIKNLINYV